MTDQKRASVGIPYAPAFLDETGYGLECPVCKTRCYAYVTALSEDEVTKSASECYAAHYERMHA